MASSAFRKRRSDHRARAAWAQISPGLNLAFLASNIGISRAAVGDWVQVPKKWVPLVSDVTKIPPHTLRPDLYESPNPSRPWRD